MFYAGCLKASLYNLCVELVLWKFVLLFDNEPHIQQLSRLSEHIFKFEFYTSVDSQIFADNKKILVLMIVYKIFSTLWDNICQRH